MNAIQKYKCYHDFGSFAKKVILNKAALSGSVGATGGYLIPQEMSLAIQDRLREFSVFHNLARQQPMASRECDIPSLDLNASHAAGESPLFGGLSLTWTSEGSTLVSSEPSFANSKLIAHDLEAVATVSNQLVADGGEPLGAYLEWAFACAIEWAVERECFKGNGVGKPLGVINAPAAVLVTRASAAHVTIDDLSTMLGKLLPACYGNAIWCVNPSAMKDISSLADFGFFQHKEALPNLCGYLFGRPCYTTEKLPAIGVKGDVTLFDPTQYVLGTRGMEISQSTHSKFLTNQTVYRLVWRGDGQPIPRGTAILADGVTTAGAFVVLN